MTDVADVVISLHQVGVVSRLDIGPKVLIRSFDESPPLDPRVVVVVAEAVVLLEVVGVVRFPEVANRVPAGPVIVVDVLDVVLAFGAL
jgi:hypothetical protein